MERSQLFLASLVLLLMGGCVSSLNTIQKSEYMAFKNNKILVTEKNPTTGAVLGLLPGGGSFYVREPGTGIAGLFLWPLSIFWEPINGFNGAKVINYNMTKYKIRKNKETEILRLDGRLVNGELDDKQYILEKRKIEQKYNFD